MSLWFFGWVGSVFLSSTRVVFAASFDRILPERVASISKNGVPYWALALMLLPSIPLAALYAWSSSFASYTLDATLVIAITFLGTTVSAAILPWRKPEIYNASPIAKYRVLGLPMITFAALLFAAILIWALIKWFSDDAYGVNNTDSFIPDGRHVRAGDSDLRDLADRAQTPGDRPRDGLRGDSGGVREAL